MLESHAIGVMICMTLVVGILPLILIVTKTLPLGRHIFFFFLFAQVAVYLFVAPTLIAIGDPGIAEQGLLTFYVQLQAVTLLLFVAPLVLVYRAATQSLAKRKTRRQTLQVQVFSAALLSALSLLLVARVAWILVSQNLVFRRIGFDGLVAAYSQMPRVDFVILRVFDHGAIGLICFLLVVWKLSRPGKQKLLTLGALCGVWSTQFLSVLINSRLQALFTVALPLVVWVHWGGAEQRLRRRVVVCLTVILLSVPYIIKVNSTVRTQWSPEARLSDYAVWINPFYAPPVPPVESLASSMPVVDPVLETTSKPAATKPKISVATPVLMRLNGIDLMARLTPRASAEGFSKGRSWVPGLWAVFGRFVGSEKSAEYRLRHATTAKYHLMRRYTELNQSDYYSCVLTDAYGNFGNLGILLAAVCIGGATAVLHHAYTAPQSSVHLLVGLMGLSVVALFEAEFLVMFVLNWVPLVPLLILLAAVNPIEVAERRHAFDKQPVPPTLSTAAPLRT